ncbi:hypothetical protein [uncultured Cellulomonas sp.]|uniref:hypothetical protein n=1 Tax=uncultured Cellulomonas sp. TaxID=189682 RepID=UPI002622E309|nr:hypothetical protein [uncultured Cellulomonas sp.]
MFPSPGSLTEGADDELYDALIEVDDALAAIAGGLRRDGFATGAYNACIATLDDVLSSSAQVLTAEQVRTVTRLREAVAAFG